MFKKLLIANRGEIACRIIKTARRLGIKTVAVYSDADADAMHVAMADEAHHIGGSAPGESYLRVDAVIDAAIEANADAIHPGYGFLSENAQFAAACAEVGITFVGPPVEAISAMGSKSESKRIMESAAVPLIPGYHGDDQSEQRLQQAAEQVGYPILLKASAGGGGRGMRVVQDPSAFADALAGAKREAKGAFGDDRMLIETYITEPRHIEVQVFGDHHGNMVHLYERDCSAQRRHQKIVEEAPAPGVSEAIRGRLCDAALSAAKAIGYVGAGTVEMLLDASGRFYFMEMNTRLQVEHPVTELITGEDLVEWQLEVAAGNPLPLRQGEISIQGHAIEARLYAEDPSKNFMPSTGHLAHLEFPAYDPLVRVDSGVRSGDDISFYYDPMIAKVIAWGENRIQAASRLADALGAIELVGVTTNADFLVNLLTHEAFVAGGIDTGFVLDKGAELLGEPATASQEELALGTLWILTECEAEARSRAAISADPFSPWHQMSGWRMNGEGVSTIVLESDGESCTIKVRVARTGGYVLKFPNETELIVKGERQGDARLSVNINGVRRDVAVVRADDQLTVVADGQNYRMTHVDPGTAADADVVLAGTLCAPMPGKVISINVEVGDKVRKGSTVLVMEAMKMEHNIIAPADGVVSELRYAVGDLVDEAVELIVIGEPN